MSRFWPRIASIVVATTLLGCSGTTEPLGNHVDFARALWLARRPRSYSFEVAVTSSWTSTAGYLRVEVSDGRVVAVRDPAGATLEDFSLTVDGIWDQLLAYRARGELNAARFDARGVPLETDMGPWPVDGGMHYSVRNFAASR